MTCRVGSTALALVAAYPNDLTTLVAHESRSSRCSPTPRPRSAPGAACGTHTRQRGGAPHGAAFIAMTSWRGEYTDDYFAQPAPDPAMFGIPGRGRRHPGRPAALRPVLGDQQLPARRRRAACGTDVRHHRGGRGVRGARSWHARRLLNRRAPSGQQPTVFPSHHGGFLGGESGYAGQPEAFARRLRDVLADDNDSVHHGSRPLGQLHVELSQPPPPRSGPRPRDRPLVLKRKRSTWSSGSPSHGFRPGASARAQERTDGGDGSSCVMIV